MKLPTTWPTIMGLANHPVADYENIAPAAQQSPPLFRTPHTLRGTSKLLNIDFVSLTLLAVSKVLQTIGSQGMPAQVRQTSHIIGLQFKTNPLPKLHLLFWNSPSNSIKTFNKTLREPTGVCFSYRETSLGADFRVFLTSGRLLVLLLQTAYAWMIKY